MTNLQYRPFKPAHQSYVSHQVVRSVVAGHNGRKCRITVANLSTETAAREWIAAYGSASEQVKSKMEATAAALSKLWAIGKRDRPW